MTAVLFPVTPFDFLFSLQNCVDFPFTSLNSKINFEAESGFCRRCTVKSGFGNSEGTM